MSFTRNPDNSGTMSYVDYRAARCRCGSVIRPYEVVCLQCGRKQNLLFEGLDKIYTSDLDGLIEKLERETQRNPYDYVKLHRLAGAHLLRGRYETAREIYRRVLEMKPDFSPARLNLGVVLACLGEYDAAVAELKLFVRQDPHSAKAERAIRAICSIKNIPYEDALKETLEPSTPARVSARPEAARTTAGGSLRRIRATSAHQPPSAKARKKSFAALDLFFLLLIVLIAAAWFLFPGEARSLAGKALAAMESPFYFKVAAGNIQESDEKEQNEPAASVTPAAPVIVNANPETSSYMPLAAGNTWHYVSYDTPDPSGERHRQNSGGKTITVVGLANSEQQIWQVRNDSNTVYYVERNNGLFSVESLSAPWSSMIIQVPYPPEIGKSVTTHGQTATVEAEENVETPAGVFRCVRIKYTVAEAPEIQWTAWYGQGIGLVKYRGGGRDRMYHMLELRDYTLN